MDPLAQARAALLAGRPEEAEAQGRRAHEAQPRDVDALTLVATACEQQGKLPEAIRSWMDAFAVDPSARWNPPRAR